MIDAKINFSLNIIKFKVKNFENFNVLFPLLLSQNSNKSKKKVFCLFF